MKALEWAYCMGYELDEENIPSWMKKVTVTRHTAGSKSVLVCDGCSHEWVNRVHQPQKCPECGAKIMWDDDSDEPEPEQSDNDSSDDLEELFG